MRELGPSGSEKKRVVNPEKASNVFNPDTVAKTPAVAVFSAENKISEARRAEAIANVLRQLHQNTHAGDVVAQQKQFEAMGTLTLLAAKKV